ncbi:MAG: hypothetical protein K8W52_40125 [Deltaproteobacteria bacterium]|nr:hypothetical protein [Deltaproteobacteria bacterium]
MTRIAILLACVLAGCGNPSGGEVPPGQAPTITAFTATPGTITAGASTTLAWTVSGATALRLDGIGAVTGTSTTLAPTATTTYHLVAENDAGAATADATVIVNPEPGTEATDHPRLWIRSADLPRLRGWAVAQNPTWLDLQRLATRAKDDMDAGHVAEDDGSAHYVSYPTETYAQLFAFMSLVDPDATARADWASRARALLMHAVGEAAKGLAPGQPFRDPDFAINDRSRWNGEGFPLTVDWIYGSLSAADKAQIRGVFLGWIDQDIHDSYNRPVPEDVTYDPILVADRAQVRWAGNNYATAHMRNIGLMAMALDAADDPGDALRGRLDNAIGAWLYKVDELLRTDAAGGLSPEGFEYGPQSLGYVAQFLLALRTAGKDDPARWHDLAGVQLSANPFWAQVVPAYVNSLSPVPITHDYRGPLYECAWYGDGQHTQAPDFIETFGPLAIYAQLTGNAAGAAQIAWIQTHQAPGGAEGLADRVGKTEAFSASILYFLTLDPAVAPIDPHATAPTRHVAPGIGRVLARTAWTDDASWFTWSLGWQGIDHQDGDGNAFELYRHGEFLTKKRIGYGYGYETSDNSNTLAIENDPPDHMDYRALLWQRGSQWPGDNDGDPTIVALSTGDPRFVAATGDATTLYDSAHELSQDVQHASRSIVWLAPDHVVIYDRATTGKADRFKRFWMGTPALATVAGARATMLSPGGQQLFVTSLLPTTAVVTAQAWPDEDDVAGGTPAEFEAMRYRIAIEDPAKPADVRFLTVVQGADAGAAASPTARIASTVGTPYAGARVGTTAVLFKVNLADAFTSTTYTVAGATTHLVTGLAPQSGYTVTRSGDTVTVTAGGSSMADAGGVLVF